MRGMPDPPLWYRWVAGFMGLVALALLSLNLLGVGAQGPTVRATPAAETKLDPASAPAKAQTPTARATPSPTADDPWPLEPAAQIEWVARNRRPAMILFHSTMGRACLRMEELVATVRGDYEPAIVFIEVVTDDRVSFPLLREAEIRSIPTFFFLPASGAGKRVAGAMKEAELRAELDALCVE